MLKQRSGQREAVALSGPHISIKKLKKIVTAGRYKRSNVVENFVIYDIFR